MDDLDLHSPLSDGHNDSVIKVTGLAVVLSLGLHAAVFSLFLRSEIGSLEQSQPAAVSIALVTRNPLRAEQLVAPELPIPQDFSDALEPEPPAQQSEPEAAVQEIAEESLEFEPELKNLAESVSPPDQENREERSVGVIALPTPAAIARSLRGLRSQGQSRYIEKDCTPLEEESAIKDCTGASPLNLSNLDNPVYRALNPVRELSRAQQSLDVVSSRTGELTSRLNSVNIPLGLSEYVLHEVEAGISHNINEGNRSVNHLIDMTSRSSAAAQAKQVLEDGWVIKRSRELEKRKVELP